MGRAVQVDFLLDGLRDNNGAILASGKVYHYAAGTSSDKDVYTASDKSATAAQPVVLDSYGRAQIWADGAYKFVVKTSADVTLYTYDNLRYYIPDSVIDAGGTATGSSNAFACTVSPAITAYADGQVIRFISNQDITGSATLAVNGLTAYTIVKGKTPSNLKSGDIKSGDVVMVQYESASTRWRLLSPHYSELVSYTPTVSVDTGSISLTTTDYYKYELSKNGWCEICVKLTCNIASGSPTQIRVSLPFTASSVNSGAFTGYVSDTSSIKICAGDLQSTTTLKMFGNALPTFAVGSIFVFIHGRFEVA